MKKPLTQEQLDQKERVCKFRNERGITQEKFVEPLGYSLSYYKKIEQGDCPVSKNFAERLHEIYQADVTYILYGTQDPDEVAWNAYISCSSEQKVRFLLRLIHQAGFSHLLHVSKESEMIEK